MQCSNSWFNGQRKLVGLTLYLKKYFVKGLLKKKNTQIHIKNKKQNADKIMLNYPIQWDLIGINGKIDIQDPKI